MKIGFLSNKLTLRGTEVNLYDYARYNEEILKNESVILTRPYDHVLIHSRKDVHPAAYKKFQDRFKVEYYINPNDIIDIVKKNNIDVLFIEKAGDPNDGLVFDCCKTIIHCVFTSLKCHGTAYTVISQHINDISKTNYKILPNIVDIYETDENLKKDLNIPDNAIVFGTYSGADEFNIDYVIKVIRDIVNDPKYDNIYFIFMNVIPFMRETNRIRFLDGTADMQLKRKFINTCNGMIYGRNDGETFGIACGEFSICNKPVIAKSFANARAHFDILKDNMIKHSNYNELHDTLTNWNKYNKDVSNNDYNLYRPEKVMEIFKEVLDNL